MEKIDINYGENCLGFVVRIISDKEIIIDVGEDDLTIGDEIQIYSPSDEIFDLDGDSLGIYEQVKETLEVTYTSMKYSICKKISRITQNVLDPMGDIFTTTVVREETIKVESKSIKPMTNIEDPIIRIGDPVKKR